MKLLMLILAQLFLVLAAANPAFAGFRRGNGGHILNCNSEAGKSYDLLDMYEATHRYHYDLEFAPSGDEFQRAQKIIDRLKIINPTRHQMYSQWLASFPSETAFIENMKIVDVADLGVVFIPKNCRVRQMIMQVEPLRPQDKRYTIDQSLWQRLDINQRAASIVHELIYREAISLENQHPHSEFVRSLNGFMHSSQMPSVHLREWLFLVRELGFHEADAHGLSVRLNSFADSTYTRKSPAILSFYDQDHLRMAEIPWKFKFDLFNTRYNYICESNLFGTTLNSFILFFETGKPKTLALFHGPECSDFNLNVFTPTLRIAGPIQQISFAPNGELKNVKFTRDIDAPRSFFQIGTEKVEIFREFLGVDSIVDFELEFQGNQPVKLINEVFNSQLSTTRVKMGDAWVEVEDKPVQDL